MKMKKMLAISFVFLFLCSSLCGCRDGNKNKIGESGSNESSEQINPSISSSESSFIESDESSSVQETEATIGGIPITFEDSQLKICVANSLGISSDETITDKMCETVTKIDCTGYTLSTLSDLEMFPSLTEIYIDNSDKALDLKGINKAPNLTSITLRNCKLSEVDRIADLTNLVYLDISTSSSWGTNVNDYSSLAALTNLKYLDMSWTGYNAYNEFGVEDASFINSLTNLEELNIYETGIENYSLSKLLNLKKLTISQCNADEILQQLCSSGSISKMENLTIYGRGYSGQMSNDGLRDYLSQAVNLKYLYLNAYDFTSLEGLGNLQNLETLYLDNGSAFDLPLSSYNELSKLRKLTELTLTGNPNSHEIVNDLDTTPDDYSFLNDMNSLKVLSIETYDGMGIACFSGLDNLEKLTLGSYHTFVHEVDISGIEKFGSLKDFLYCGIRFKSSAPLDDLDYLNVEEFSGLSW